jgi:hypothetical protein
MTIRKPRGVAVGLPADEFVVDLSSCVGNLSVTVSFDAPILRLDDGLLLIN